MPPRYLVVRFAALLVLVALALAAACGGGDDTDTNVSTGKLTDPQDVPTATPWQSAPPVVLLDPNNVQPLPPNQPNTGGGGGVEPTPIPGEPGVCGQTYTVVAEDTMFGIAEKCGVNPQRLIDVNPNADPASLNIGDVLLLPEAEAAAPEAEAAPEEEPAPEEAPTETAAP